MGKFKLKMKTKMKIISGILLIIPYIVLIFGIGYYSSNEIIAGMTFFAWFLVIMAAATALFTYIAYRINKQG